MRSRGNQKAFAFTCSLRATNCRVVQKARQKYLDPARSPRQGLTLFERQVLTVADSIPPGHVMSYGDIAEYLGDGTARMVARVMSTKSDPETPWQRVIKSDGTCASEVAIEQLVLLKSESTPFVVRGNNRTDRVDLRIARWIPPPDLLVQADLSGPFTQSE